MTNRVSGRSIHSAILEKRVVGDVVTRFELYQSIVLPRPLHDVFPFFAAPENLEQLTPPWLHFRIRSALPIVMSAGVSIDYRLRLHGIPLGWTSEITVWEPPNRFVDEQRRGPYRLWRHEHLFEACNGTTIASDRVSYALWGGRIMDRLLVRRDLDRIFAYRHQQLRAHFG